MIFGGVFEKFPKLKVAFAHGGGSFPATIGRVQQGFDVRPDLCQTRCKVAPKDYIGKFWVDSLVHDEDMIKYMTKLMGSEKIMLGSDYPFPLGEHHPGKMIEGMTDFDDKHKRNIFEASFLDFLGLDRERFV